MTISFRTTAASFLFSCALMLTACGGPGGQTAASPAAPTLAPSSTPTATNSPVSSPSPAVSSFPNQTHAPGTSSAPSASPPATSADTNKFIKELFELAKQGKVPGVSFAAQKSLIDDVEKAWGEPDKKESAGSGIYATYSKKNAVFGFNKGSQIFDVRSDEAQLQKLTLLQIKQALGTPQDTKVNGDGAIYIYNVNKQFQLKFIISKTTGNVDHISVFSPQDAINNMAN